MTFGIQSNPEFKTLQPNASRFLSRFIIYIYALRLHLIPRQTRLHHAYECFAKRKNIKWKMESDLCDNLINTIYWLKYQNVSALLWFSCLFNSYSKAVDMISRMRSTTKICTIFCAGYPIHQPPTTLRDNFGSFNCCSLQPRNNVIWQARSTCDTCNKNVEGIILFWEPCLLSRIYSRNGKKIDRRKWLCICKRLWSLDTRYFIYRPNFTSWKFLVKRFFAHLLTIPRALKKSLSFTRARCLKSSIKFGYRSSFLLLFCVCKFCSFFDQNTF